MLAGARSLPPQDCCAAAAGIGPTFPLLNAADAAEEALANAWEWFVQVLPNAGLPTGRMPPATAGTVPAVTPATAVRARRTGYAMRFTDRLLFELSAGRGLPLDRTNNGVRDGQDTGGENAAGSWAESGVRGRRCRAEWPP